MDFWLVESENEKGIWYLFRQENVRQVSETKIDLSEGYISTDKPLYDDEKKHISEKILKKSTSHCEIIAMNREGLTDLEIAKKVGTTVTMVQILTTDYWADKMNGKND